MDLMVNSECNHTHQVEEIEIETETKYKVFTFVRCLIKCENCGEVLEKKEYISPWYT